VTTPIYGLTPAQADCARVIAAMTTFEGNSPTYEEIAAELSLADKSGAHRLVMGLNDRGWIEPYPNGAIRAIRLTRSPPPFNGNPITITEAGREYLRAAGEAA